MASKRERVTQIERALGLKFNEVDFDDVMQGSLSPCISYDEKGRVSGVNLQGQGLAAVPEGLRSFAQLARVNLIQNLLMSVPDWLLELPHLLELLLSENRISRLDPTVLTSGLPVTFDRGTWATPQITLADNPLEQPPLEIVERGNDALRDYFRSLKGETRRLNEAKVLFVGDGGSGKTSLVLRLLKRGFDGNQPQTHGIKIEPWDLADNGGEIRVRLWDFGGQDIMHATHQFFLSERSLYVLVLDGRKEEDAEYWLKHIESFGGDSPILVVLNKIDENPSFDLNRRFLKQHYPGIVDFVRVSCKRQRDKGVREFRQKLVDSLSQIEIVQTTWPVPWFGVKSALEEMDKPFISLEDYEGLCADNGVDSSNRGTLVRFLNDLGVVVHFDDFRLHQTHVLDPRWLTGGVYRIINSGLVADGGGILKLSWLRRILRGADPAYPASQHASLVDLMRKFEICYVLDDDTLLIPDLLDIQEPELDIDPDQALHFRIEYDFLPKSIIARLIVRMHESIKADLRWRTGVVLEDKGFKSTAVVRVVGAGRYIEILVADEGRRDYLTVIRSVLLDINRGFEKLSFREVVPLYDDPRISVSFEHLLRLERSGQEEYWPDRDQKAYKVKDLLGTVTIEKRLTQKEFLGILKRAVREGDTRETALSKANDILQLQPSFMGIGLNLNA